MITEKDLQAAIAECQGVSKPNRETCMMLAAFYTIQDHLYPAEYNNSTYSYASEQTDQVSYNSGTEFSEAIKGKDINTILPILDEAMDAVKTLLPRLYNGIMRKLTE